MLERDNLRPIESVILKLRDEGNAIPEIAKRIGKKPGTVERFLEMIDHKSDVPDQKDRERAPGTPVERVIQKHRDAGETYGVIGNRLNMSGDRVRAIEGFAELRPDEETS